MHPQVPAIIHRFIHNHLTTEAGKFQPNENSTECLRCPRGYLQVAAGQTACNPCPANEFSSELGSYTCKNCEVRRVTSVNQLTLD